MQKTILQHFFWALALFVACTNPAPDTMQADPGKPGAIAAVVDGFNKDLFADHNPGRLDTLLADNFISHHFPAPTGNNNKAAFIGGMQGLFAGFPDIRVTIREQREFGDKVFQYGYWEGTQTGAFMGIEPTDKIVHVEYMDIWRVQDGKIAENWVVMDVAGLLVQLGVMPPPGSGK